MPRVYKRQLGSARRNDYDPENIERALEAVMNHNVSFSQAAQRFSVPKTTLYNKNTGVL